MTLTAQQLDLRRTGIGSSEIGAVAGLSPFSGPLAVWLQKTGRSTFDGNDQTEIGDLLEEPIARLAQKRLGLPKLVRGTTCPHRRHPWILATPDYLAPWDPDSPCIVECKNVGHRMMHHWGDGPDDVPDYYRAQVEWQMEVLDVEVAHVAALLGGREFRLYEIHRDRDLFEALRTVAERFWFDHVVAGVQPAPDGTAAARAYLAERYPRNLRPLEDATPEVSELMYELADIRGAMKHLEKREAITEQRLKDYIGEREGFKGEGFVVTWKNEKQGRVAWEAVARALGATDEVIERHRGTPPRKFTPRWKEST